MKTIVEKASRLASLAAASLLIAVLFVVNSCDESETPPATTNNNVCFTPCQQSELRSSSESSDKVEVKFTDEGIEIVYSDFEVTCDFTTVNVTHTLVNGVLNITQQASPNRANCVCYTDVSYTIEGILREEVNVIFINDVQVYCYNENYPKEVLFEEYSLEGTSCRWTNLNYDKSLIVINSNEELGNFINCTDGSYPEIDFTKQTLLLMSGGTSMGIEAIEKRLQQISDSAYKLDIEILLNDATVAPKWVIALVINKINKDSNIEVDVTINIEENNNCKWRELSPSILTEQLKNDLDIIFSENNELAKNIKGDTLLYVINSKEELLAISGNINTAIDIDFENQSIIWGKFLTSSVSNTIASKQLLKCHPFSNYRYEISVKNCTECWTALGCLYYWDIYPQKININDVSLIIN